MIEGVFKESFVTTSYDSVMNWAKTGSQQRRAMTSADLALKCFVPVHASQT